MHVIVHSGTGLSALWNSVTDHIMALLDNENMNFNEAPWELFHIAWCHTTHNFGEKISRCRQGAFLNLSQVCAIEKCSLYHQETTRLNACPVEQQFRKMQQQTARVSEETYAVLASGAI